jgi:hypothetical protein
MEKLIRSIRRALVSKDIPADENPKEPISGTDIERQLRRSSMLERYGQQALEKVIWECKVSKDMAKKLRRSGRINLHLVRMLRRSEPERNFSLAYLRNRDAILAGDEEGKYTILNVIASEGEDTKMFWTFAPYLFKALVEKGLTEGDAVAKILSWSKDGESVYTGGDWYRLHLKGLEKYKRGWVLSEDPEHISHRFTEQEADRIADLLIDENDEK